MGTTDGVIEETEAKDMTAVGNSDVPSELEEKIIRQIEYYFGNYNLPKDKFLMQQTKLDDGWVPLETMVKFNRLKSLSTDFKVITDALKKSPSALMEVSEDGLKIRRHPEKQLPEFTDVLKEEIVAKTLYVKGFPISITLDQLMEFFKNKAVIENIQMRRNPNTRTFKGSIFATFETKEAAENFKKSNTKLKYKDRTLSIETKAEYMKRKDEEHKQRLEEKMKKAESKNAGDVKEEGEEEQEELKYPKGCILRLTGLGENTTWEDIKEVFKQYGDIAFVEYSKGLPEASIRFVEGTSAADVLEKATSGDSKVVQICGADVTPVVLEGEDEAEFWRKFQKARSKFKNRNKFGQKKGRAQQGGKYKKGNKRKGDKSANEPLPKKQKDESQTSNKTTSAVKQENATADADMTNQETSKAVKTEPADNMGTSDQTASEPADNNEDTKNSAG